MRWIVFKALVWKQLVFLWFYWEWIWFWERLPRNKVPNNHFPKSVWKSNCLEIHRNSGHLFHNIWLSISFLINSSMKLVIINITYLYRKITTKILAQATNKYTMFMFSKTGRLLFLSMVSEVTVRKQNSQQALL